MATKEEYEKALKEMNDAFYGITFLNSQTRRFDDNLNLLRELVNEHFEEKQETNYEHYKDEIVELCIDDLALSNGKISRCDDTLCRECGFADEDCECIRCYEIKKWFQQPYKKPPYKLSQFEFDLIQTYSDYNENYILSKFNRLIKLKDKGYFKGVDYDTKIQDILTNCEVIER